MSLSYCIPTYNSFDTCVQAVHGILRGSNIPDHIIIADDSGSGAGLVTILPELQAANYAHFQVWVHEIRCGVAATWNQFMRQCDTDFVLIANDDVTPHYCTIELMLKAAEEYPDELFFCGDGQLGNSFSFFMARRAAFIDKVGLFDERFWPAYFEDNDASRRITLAGFKHIFVTGATYDHVGSSTLHHYTREEQHQHHIQFRANKEYYIQKWGGEPGKEIYHVPFGGV